MRVALHDVKGCPSWKLARRRPAEALRSAGRDHIPVDLDLVETPEQATKLKFIGFPDHQDRRRGPFAAGDEPCGLACRLYDTPARRAGSPTPTQLLMVLS